MNAKMMSCLLACILMLQLKAEKPDTTMMKTMPFQISLVTPLGTNGMQSWNTLNHFSVNLFSGFNGGLNGAEFSGFAGVIKSDMRGAQFSGFANANLAESKGAAFAGYANYNRKYMKGAQFSGFVNAITDSADVFQGAGFANLTTGRQKGAQAAGFANVVTDDVKGAQIAGFANVATGDVDGIQISGCFNVARNVKGVQIGVFNYADSISNGVALGIISVVKNGYRALELSSNESMYTNMRFKTGTKSLYSILALGATLRKDKYFWGWGFGLGTLIPLSRKTELSVEATSMHINEEEWFTDRLNLLNKIEASFSWQFHKNFSLYGGPSWNVMVSENEDKGKVFETPFVPWTVYDEVHKNTRVQMYPGFQVGIKLNN